MHVVKIVAISLCCAGFGFLGYRLYQQQQMNTVLLDKIKMELEYTCAVTAPSNAPDCLDWGSVHTKVRDTVVQVFVCSAQFNWVATFPDSSC